MSAFDNSSLTSVPVPEEEDALMFDVGDYTLGWRASGLALERASAQGVEVGELLADLQRLFASDLDEKDLEETDEDELEEELEMEGGVSDLLGIVGTVIFVGALHFEPQIERDAILAILGVDAINDVPVDEMLSRIFPAIQDEEDTVGKGKEEESSES
jgi:hypothetical protein